MTNFHFYILIGGLLQWYIDISIYCHYRLMMIFIVWLFLISVLTGIIDQESMSWQQKQPGKTID